MLPPEEKVQQSVRLIARSKPEPEAVATHLQPGEKAPPQGRLILLNKPVPEI